VESFKSTLEVAVSADFLIHVVDSAGHDPDGQIEAVRVVLAEIGADTVPELLVFNKADIAPDVAAEQLEAHPGSCAVSATTGAGVEHMLQVLADRLRSLARITELLLPYERGDLLAAVHREGEVVSVRHDDGGVHVMARLSDASRGRFIDYVQTV
jgi:GTPase